MSDSSTEIVAGRKVYRCGTLTYTKMGLVAVFGWLLWGDFVYTLMESVWPQILPLFLLKAGATPQQTLWIKTTIPQIIGFVACPMISFKSDRHRGRWGRRIPFIFWTAPFLSLFLGALGFSAEIIDWMNWSAIPHLLGLSPLATALVIIGLLGVGFNFFNEFVGSVYWYLFNDVVPKDHMGRFLGWFRFVGAGATLLFGRYVYPHTLEPGGIKWIFLGAAALYLVGFALLCWRVKEGEYPPVTDVTERTGVVKQIALFFRECFTHPIYVLVFLSTGLGAIGGLAGIGGQVFLLSLGITMGQLGNVIGITALVSMFLQPPCGWVVDKVHPLRVVLATATIGVALTVLQYFFLWDWPSYLTFTAAGLVFANISNAAGIPLLMHIFPRDKYGQFCSANGATKSLAQVVGSFAAGPFVDWISNCGKYEAGYRLAFLWQAAFAAMSLLCLVGVFVYWKRLGGDKGYVPPITARPEEADRIS